MPSKGKRGLSRGGYGTEEVWTDELVEALIVVCHSR
jgi:hypothetical protein